MPDALLVLADGSVFTGSSIGVAGHTDGEVVFNTSMTGYQEISRIRPTPASSSPSPTR